LAFIGGGVMRILYGGTFDPIHNGHLAIARAASEALAADVYFLPAADPPHRPRPGASAEQRQEMLTLAIAGAPRFYIDTRDLRRGGVSYAVDALREMRTESGVRAPLAWLIGADSFRTLDTWRDWHDLFELTHFVLAPRPGVGFDGASEALRSACAERWRDHPNALAQAPAGLIWPLPMAPRPESGTAIRRCLAQGEDVAGALPATVADFIRRRELYRGSV
jgi:nicotinate-nucleotide adenylyltransferase